MADTAKALPNPSANGKENKDGAQQPTPPAPALTVVKANQKTDIPPLDERLHRLGQLFDLHKKFTVLQTTLQKLQEFEFKKDDETCTLSIRDDRRLDFTTHHPGIIQEVVEFLKTVIVKKIKELEPKIVW